MSRPSVKDVARTAGVSLGTVSNVLNRPDLVRPETRARVEAAIADLGFVRNDSARQLRAGDSRTIAYLVLDAANPFFMDVARGIDAVAREAGLTVFLCDSGQDRGREDDYLDALMSQRVKGICITPVDPANPRLDDMLKRGIPVVAVDALADTARWCSVGVDDVLGGRIAADHLLATGHKRIAYAGETEGLAQSRQRLEGARAAVAEAGRAPDALEVLATPGMRVDDGRGAAARFLALPKRRRPTGIFCGNDLIALGVLQGLTQDGISVPDDVSLVGYDDIDFAAAAAVPLTSVMQPRLEMGRAATQSLLAEASEGDEHEHRHVTFAPELVIRRSTGG